MVSVFVIAFTIILFFFCVLSNVSANIIEALSNRLLLSADYYWRDFGGLIPIDALIAGKARDDTPIYIGQALYDNKLIPGKIHHNSSQIHIEFKTVHVLNETIKILCTKHPEKFVWLQTSSNQIHNIQNKHIFEGGYEKGVLTYVGRTTSHGELTVGKVICWDDGDCIALTTVENGKFYYSNTFEILTYDDSVPSITTVESTTEVPTIPTDSDDSLTITKDSNTDEEYNKNHYYWRDFDDAIPNDALLAGKAQEGMLIYIGQVFHDNKLIPGPIYYKSSENRVEFGIKEHNALNEPIKILCTEHPEKFIWTPTTINNILYTTRNGSLFVGGYEKGYITYIGRITLHGVLKVEKIICQFDPLYSGYCRALDSLEGRYWMRLSSFEILTLDDTVSPIEVPTTNQADIHSISITTKYSGINTDYYSWRDFNGVVPNDALIVGRAQDGTQIYLGQILYNNMLIPGKIHHNSSQIHIDFKAIDILDGSVKILCTKHPKNFVWVRTATNETFNVQNKDILRGGYENGELTYVGRTILHGELSVGRVICTENSLCIPLTIIEAEKGYGFYIFEILTFDATSSPNMVAKLTTT